MKRNNILVKYERGRNDIHDRWIRVLQTQIKKTGNIGTHANFDIWKIHLLILFLTLRIGSPLRLSYPIWDLHN